jgi:hypothetical protein
VIAVPLREVPGTDFTAVNAWLDFSEEVRAIGPGCTVGPECDTQLCLEGLCFEHRNPELRGVGWTPLGRSLFYAGEYLRHFVLVEGRACTADADCASPHHTCVEGTCHDPFVECRPNVVVVFTDGGENENDGPEDFFNPRTQARRFHFGLGCAGDADCTGGAACREGRCVPPIDPLPGGACRGTNRACQRDSECPEYSCGQLAPCGGQCASAGLHVVDGGGHDVLRDAGGRPVSVTVHAVDTSGSGDAALIALFGGGRHLRVDFSDVASLLAAFLTVLPDKVDPEACQ